MESFFNEDFLSLFVISAGFWVWFISISFFIIILAFTENDKNFFAIISLTIFMLLMYHSDFISLINPVYLIKYVILYFIIGTIWSFFKWYFFIKEKFKNYGKLKLIFIDRVNRSIKATKNGRNKDDTYAFYSEFIQTLQNGLVIDIKTTIPEKLEERFKKHLKESDKSYYRNNIYGSIKEMVIPLAKDYKQEIVTWILWWPTSAFWTILNDPLVKLANIIYERFQGIYTKISVKVFENFEI